MKVFHVLLGVFLFIVLLVSGLFVLSSAFQGPEVWSKLAQEIAGRRVESILAGVVLVLAVMLYALSAFRLPEKSQYLAYDIEGGSVSISLKAVENFLARLASEFAAVDELEPTIKTKNGVLDVQLDVKVKAGSQIPELCRMLQDRARVTIREKVGISDVQSVRVRVQEITGSVAAGKETLSGDIRPESFS